MSTMIYVVPASAGSKLVHPVSGTLPDTGADWLADQFTFRLIQERALLIGVKPEAPFVPAQTPEPEPEPVKEEAPTPEPAPKAEPAQAPAPDAQIRGVFEVTCGRSPIRRAPSPGQTSSPARSRNRVFDASA